MITQKTSGDIWNAYREIKAGEKLLADMQEVRKKEADRLNELSKSAPTLKDAFGRTRHLQLSIPSGESAHRLLDVAPELAESVIRSHIKRKELELTEAQERARIELDSPVNSTEGNQ